MVRLARCLYCSRTRLVRTNGMFGCVRVCVCVSSGQYQICPDLSMFNELEHEHKSHSGLTFASGFGDFHAGKTLLVEAPS
jgi:hypothetical protein